MGNNPSSTRKSSAARHASTYRKSSQSQAASNNLEEEFSTLILHEVKRQTDASAAPDVPRMTQMEDEFNELNDDLLDSEVYAVHRNILPEDSSDEMQVDPLSAAVSSNDHPSSELFGSLSKVDFTKIADPAIARQPIARSTSALSTGPTSPEEYTGLVPVEIKWVNLTKQNIGKVAIIGSFCNWRDVIKLKRLHAFPNEYSTIVKLPLGVHKLLYIVNNEYRVLDQLPTATDQEGIFFNWFEVLDPHRLFNQSQKPHYDASTGFDANIIQVAGDHDTSLIQKKSNSFLFKVTRDEKESPQHVEYVDLAVSMTDARPDDHTSHPESQSDAHVGSHTGHSGASRHDNHSYDEYRHPSMLSLNPPQPPDTFSSEIPEMFVNYDYFKSMSPNYELPEPPQLPAHLNNVLLNKISNIQQQQHHHHHNHHHANNIPVGTDPSFNRPSLRRADSSYYASNKQAYHQSIPNHVILNHLMTTSIRNDVLTVACITRYSGKFVTQIMHSPATLGDSEAQ